MYTNDWFTKVFGFTEKIGSDYEETRNNFKLENDGKKNTLISKGKERKFQVGDFKTPHVAELREICKNDTNHIKKHLKGPLKVAEIVADVSELHIKPENRYAVFQVASQFNCLEFPDPSQKPEDGITVYEYDRTQGPACAIACAPATVYRNYFGMPGKQPQTQNSQVDNLGQVLKSLRNDEFKFLTCKSGYTDASNDDLKKFKDLVLNDKGPKQRDDNKDIIRKNLRIGQQIDTQVTGWKFGQCQLRDEESDEQIVTQVFCSACSVSYSRSSAENWAPFAEVILEAAYEGVMLTAIKNALMHKSQHGSKKVFLTALGGGVFGNSDEWIIGAMKRAFDMFRGINLEVYIVSFGNPWPAARDLLKDWE